MNLAVSKNISLIKIPKRLAKEIVSSVYFCAEEMKEEVATTKRNYITSIQDSGKFWDKLNTRNYWSLKSHNCSTSVVKNGFWPLVLSCHTPTGIKFSLMREYRFRNMQRDIKKHGKLTYPNVLIQTMNKDLQADPYQMSLFSMHNYDKENLAERIESLMSEFFNDNVGAGYYMLILFDCDTSYELRGIRAVIVDPNLNIVESADWSGYIPVKESAIVEKVFDPSLYSNNPSRGRTLKDKAHVRKATIAGITHNQNDVN